MLKTVIQKKNVDGPPRLEPVALGETVFAHAKRDAALQSEFHQFDFVASATHSSVAAAQDRNTLAISEKFLGEPNHHGRFAGAANRQIPDADDNPIQAFLLEPSVGIKPNTRADSDTIQQ
jgi:hypothetical protein